MRWHVKAGVMFVAAFVPFGARAYVRLQRRFGRLDADPAARLQSAAAIASWASLHGRPIREARVLEVGTGHKPIVPLGLSLLGAGHVVTVDLHRRLDWDLVRQSLEWMRDHGQEVECLLGVEDADRDGFRRRLAAVTRQSHRPAAALEAAGVEYRAPGDAARSGLASGSIDLHVSAVTFEHIPPEGLRAIMREAGRVVSGGGLAIHFIDPSDHFEHQDHSILPINFLRFSEPAWRLIAGNEFAYCNRLRRSDYLRLFAETGWSVLAEDSHIDAGSLAALQGGLGVHERFRGYALEDLCTTSMNVLLAATVVEGCGA